MKKLILSLAAVATAATVSAQVTADWGVKAGVDFSNYKVSLQKVSAKANLGTKTGFYVGAVNNLNFNDWFSLQTELTYNLEGIHLGVGSDVAVAIAGLAEMPAEMTGIFDNNMAVGLTMHNLRLPIMAKFETCEGLSVMAGPYISYRVGMSLNPNSNLEDLLVNETFGFFTQEEYDNYKTIGKDIINDNIKKFDVGASLGLEYKFDFGMFIDARYTFSFLNSLKKDIDITSIPSQEDAPDVNLKDLFGFQPTVKYNSLQIGLGFRF